MSKEPAGSKSPHGSRLSSGPLSLPPRRPDVRDALLQAAGDLMIERDTLDVALTDVAQGAGVNSALVQYYFGSKDGFMVALLERDIGDAVRQMRILLAGDGTARDKLTAHLAGMARAYHRVPYLNQLLRRVSAAADDAAYGELVRRLIEPILDFYAQVLAQGVSEGDFRVVDPMALYLTVVGICDAFSSNRRLLSRLGENDPSSAAAARTFSDHLTQLVIFGIAA